MNAALMGFLGVIIGAVLQAALQCWLDERTHRRETAAQNKLDDQRKTLLKKALQNPDYKWRKIETLSSVIGADYETTTRLLIELGARGSTSEKDVWKLARSDEKI